jgi:uncharacterized protein with PIN domain
MIFVCDMMLGKLARYLRVFGLDAVSIKSAGELTKYLDNDTACRFLTRRTELKGRDRVVFIYSDRPKEQLIEIRDIVSPYVESNKIMTRCIGCNVPLKDIPKQDIEQYVPEFIFHRYETFKACPSCGKVYWEGTHAAAMMRLIEEVCSDRIAK